MKYVNRLNVKHKQFLEQCEEISTPTYLIFYTAERNDVTVKGIAESFNSDAMAAKIETIAKLEGELNCKNIEILAIESTVDNNNKMLAESTINESPVLDIETVFNAVKS